MRTFLLFFILSILSVYLSIATMDKSKLEKKIIYRPMNRVYKLIPPIYSKAEKSYFYSQDGVKLNYMRIKGRINSPVIVFCHGNSGNMTRPGNQNKLKFLVDKGYQLFTFDYRGYGLSEGMINEKGLYTDLASFIEHINIKYKIPKSRIVLWGHSLGSAVVIDTASKMKLKGVIIEGAFTSIEEVKKYKITCDSSSNSIFLKIRDLFIESIPITQKFSTKDKIRDVKSPILIIHAINDNIIPCEMGKKLAKLKPDACVCISKTGGHCDYGWQDKYVINFLKTLH